MMNHDRAIEDLFADLQQSEVKVMELNKCLDDHKTLAKELSQERDLYTDLANALPAGIYRLRVFRDGSISDEKWSSTIDAPYAIEFANNRFFEILHINRADFLANPGIINGLILEADKEEFVRRNVEANLHKIPFIWEGRIVVGGNLIWVHFESIPRVVDNGDIIWTGTLNDISKRKSAELEIASKNQELKRLNAEKVKFFSIIAHDLKSPFNAIIGYSELLIEKITHGDIQKIDEFGHMVLQMSNRAMDLLKNLMEWAQSQTDRMEFNPECFELERFINETTLIYEDIAAQKSIAIKKVLPNNGRVFADKAMISTVFRNLISNAIKFTQPGGEVVISAIEKPDEIIFLVKDSGIGISPKRIARIFQIDQAYSTSGTNKETGTGLGLMLCKEFVGRHGGKIWVESQEQQGSTFYFSLPSKVDLTTE